MAALSSRCFAGALCVCLVLTHVVYAAPPVANYETLRELYEQVIAGEGLDQGPAGGAVGAGASPGLIGLLGGPGGAGAPLSNHQLVRKSNRTPSLRLRYGRRSDPGMKSTCLEQPAVDGNDG